MVGLYEKFRVERTDGKPIAGRVFVLCPDSDPAALAALARYARAVAASNPDLARDIRRAYFAHPTAPDAGEPDDEHDRPCPCGQYWESQCVCN